MARLPAQEEKLKRAGTGLLPRAPLLVPLELENARFSGNGIAIKRALERRKFAGRESAVASGRQRPEIEICQAETLQLFDGMAGLK